MTSQIEVTPTRLYIRALVSGTADSAEVRIYQSDSLMGWHCGHVRTFPSLEGIALEGRNVRTSFARRLEKGKLREIRIHDLRHTYATLMLQAGAPITKEQGLVSGSRIGMLLRKPSLRRSVT